MEITLTDCVYSYPTQYKQGFTEDELIKFASRVEELNPKSFVDLLIPEFATNPFVQANLVEHYKVEKALFRHFNKRYK
jgi:hypothetical protein